MCEVTAINFEAVLPEVEAALQTCQFMSIDAEFTGLDVNKGRRDGYYDTYEQRYQRVRESGSNFLIMQFGLSLFEWDCEANCYKARTYNFFVFPRPSQGIDVRFLCQASSLDFLQRHNFDFNKFVYQGISYLNLANVQSAEERLQAEAKRHEELAAAANQGPPQGAAAQAALPDRKGPLDSLRTDADRARIAEIIERVRAWVDASQNDGVAINGADAGGSTIAAEGEARSALSEDNGILVLEPMNSFWRAVVYDALRRNFGENIFRADKAGSGPWASVRLTRAEPAQLRALEAAAATERRRELERAVGFGRVVQALVSAKKPVIGHNMLLDLAYFYNQFVGELPPTVEGFRSEVSSIFPAGIFDTKHLALTFPECQELFQGSTSLAALYSIFGKLVRTTRPQEEPPSESPPPESGGPGRQTEAETIERVEIEETVVREIETADTTLLSKTTVKQVVEVKIDARASLPKVEHAEGFERYNVIAEGSDFAHEAGYDAWMTGVSFLGLALLAQEQGQPNEAAELEAISAEANRVHVYGSDFRTLPFTGPLPPMERDHVFLLSGFSPELQTHHIIQRFAQAGLGNIRVNWIDKTTAFVALEDRTLSQGVVAALAEWEGLVTPWVVAYGGEARGLGRVERSTVEPGSKRLRSNEGSALVIGQVELGDDERRRKRTSPSSRCTIM